MKLYHVSVSGCEVHCIGACALDKIHAGTLANDRLKNYGFKPGEYNIVSVVNVGNCDWELGSTLIYN